MGLNGILKVPSNSSINLPIIRQEKKNRSRTGKKPNSLEIFYLDGVSQTDNTISINKVGVCYVRANKNKKMLFMWSNGTIKGVP